MLGGFILIYFVGRAFYNLAHEHDKNRWGFAILGVLSYYAGLFLGGIILGVVLAFISPESLDTMSDLVMGLLALPVGILVCWLFYIILKRSWTKPKTQTDNSSLDSGFINDQSDPNGNL